MTHTMCRVDQSRHTRADWSALGEFEGGLEKVKEVLEGWCHYIKYDPPLQEMFEETAKIFLMARRRREA